ncbi:MAG TPA: hypothetical protein VK662_05275 [Acidothermaceae bacterium]|jgi:hypothetical protein|nr:hypothetical protein [Acidothermaceae bacterium]
MIQLDIFGTAVTVAAPDATLTEVHRLWQPFVRPANDRPPAVTFQVGRAADPTDPAGPAVVHVDSIVELATALNRFALSVCPYLAIHAGVVRSSEGAIAFPAQSGAGKSTLTAACVRAGFGYISDEALCLSYDDNRVEPYPRPLALSAWSIRAVGGAAGKAEHDDVFGERLHSPEEFLQHQAELTRTAADQRPMLRHVVVPERATTSEIHLEPLHRADAVALLLRLSFNHFKRPLDAFAVTVAAVRVAQTWVLRYDNPVEAALVLRRELGGLLFVDEVSDV